jgi:uncharacterized protein YrrD
MPPDDAPIAWTALRRGHPVRAADGQQIGKIAQVIADEQKDIFSGITFRSRPLETERFAPAAVIRSITSESVELAIASSEASSLDAYES